jgi:hypothetical protein
MLLNLMDWTKGQVDISDKTITLNYDGYLKQNKNYENSNLIDTRFKIVSLN